MGHPGKRVPQGLIDAVFDFENLARGQLIGDLNMQIDVNVILHAVRSNGMGTADPLDLFGHRSDESGVEAGGIGNDFDPFNGDFIDGAGKEENNSDGEKRVEPRESEGATARAAMARREE